MKNYPKTLITIGVLAMVVVGISYARFQKKPAQELVTVVRGDVTREVSVTSTVKAAQRVDLAFEKSGTVQGVYVKTGDRVRQGQQLVALHAAELTAQLHQAQAQLQAAKAQMAELKRGTRAEEIVLVQTSVENASRTVNDAKENLTLAQNKATVDLQSKYSAARDSASDAYVKADDAIVKQTDELFTNDLSSNPKLTFITTDSQAENDVAWTRIVVQQSLNEFRAQVATLPTDQGALDALLTTVKGRLTTYAAFLLRLQDALNGAAGISQTTITTYKGYMNTARTEVHTALANIATQEQGIAAQQALNRTNIANAHTAVTSAQNVLQSAQKDLALKQAGATTEKLAAQEAQVKAAEAGVQVIQAQLAKSVLRSPFAGIIATQDAKVGQIITPSVPLVSVLSQDPFIIEARISEADIAEVKVGQEARVTLDAYRDEVLFAAKVIRIDPAAIMVEGVATYKTTLQFVDTHNLNLIKEGMTANVDIVVAQKHAVLLVPLRAITTKNKVATVQVLDASGVVRVVTVHTGVRGVDGTIEILNGLQEGDKVVLYGID